MEENGVTVTVIDFVHFRGHYNPVAYLKTDEDAMKLAYALVFNTKNEPGSLRRRKRVLGQERCYVSGIADFVYPVRIPAV